MDKQKRKGSKYSILVVDFSFSFSLPAAGMCTDFTFTCGNGQCVNKLNAECDKVSDCSDGSDEQGCGESLPFTAFLLA